LERLETAAFADKADTLDGDWPSCLRTGPNIHWTNMLAPAGEEPLAVFYGDPVHLDWGRAELESSEIEVIVTAVHPQAGQGCMSAVIRIRALAATPI